MMSCQMGSLNEWELSKLQPAWKKYLHLEAMPSADTMGDVAGKISIDDIRNVIKSVYRKLKRNKSIEKRIS